MNHLRASQRGSSTGITYAKQRTSPETCLANEQENGDKDSIVHTCMHTCPQARMHVSKGYRHTMKERRQHMGKRCGISPRNIYLVDTAA